MARSCGLRIGERRYELVVLDGNAKKHKIAAYATGELPHAGEDTIAAAADVLREACKKHNVPPDNVGIAIDTGLAAFRTLKLPFSDRAKIEEVIKFEVESLLPQWNVDDVIIDFHVLESTSDSSELLVTAVPKADLKKDLAICEKAGIEPLEAELETTSMVNAALQSGRCTADTAQVLVHIGEHSTAVVVVDGGRVREMRAIRIGALSHDAPPPSVPEGEAPAEGEPLAVLSDPATDAADIARKLDQANKRVRRELGRTVSAARTAHPIDAIYVCGFALPGLADSSILDVPVRPLDVFQSEDGAPTENSGPLVVAYGVALGRLGGGTIRASLRREELRYAGAFEKIELPLAVVSIVALAFVFVWLIFLKKEREILEDKLAFWRDSSRNYLIGDLKTGKKGALEFPSDAIGKYAANLAKDETRTDFEKLRFLKGQIDEEVKKLEKQLGQDTEITQPQSALQGLMIVLGAVESQIKEGATPSLRKIEAAYVPARPGKTDFVHVTLDISFFASSSAEGSQQYFELKTKLRALPGFIDLDEKTTNSLEGDKGLSVPALGVDIDVSKAKASKGA